MTEPRQKVKTGPYSDIQERKPYEKAPERKVRTQKDEPIHEEGCAICEAAPFGASGDHEHTTKERKSQTRTSTFPSILKRSVVKLRLMPRRVFGMPNVKSRKKPSLEIIKIKWKVLTGKKCLGTPNGKRISKIF